MQKRKLGKTGIEVTELCFGALPMGPIQKNVPVADCADVVEKALQSGINFIDTAQAYKTYEPIKMAMDRTGIRPVIASKSSQKTYEGMAMAVEEALGALGIDYIDIFHLHAAREGENAFEVYKDSLQCLVDMKKKGKVKAVGISTHHTAVTRLAADVDVIDVVFPIINNKGRGIMGGTTEDMLQSMEKVAKAGKGLYLMKVLGGGSLINEYDEALKFARNIEGYASIAIGMVSIPEVEFNVKYFNGELANAVISLDKAEKKAVVVARNCKSCGQCIAACPADAISFDDDNKARIDSAKCLTCGYCTPVCPEFAIRVI
ncbi:Ion-translocating oxidoreductase complex subunit B [Sporomusa rhizae]|uniref:aldo/keto reductase n=1 Tax=Sporomusa rhizae TaxID=357999 RepID=UPI00352AA9D3